MTAERAGNWVFLLCPPFSLVLEMRNSRTKSVTTYLASLEHEFLHKFNGRACGKRAGMYDFFSNFDLNQNYIKCNVRALENRLLMRTTCENRILGVF